MPAPHQSRSEVLSAGLWTSAQTLVPLVGTLAVSITIARLLGADDLGEQSWIAYLQSLLMSLLVTTVSRAGIQTLSAARGAGDDEAYAAISRWVMLALLGSAVISGAVLLAIGSVSEHRLAWLLASATASIDAVGTAYGTRLVAERGWKPLAKRRLLTQSLAQGAAVAVVVLGAGIAGVFAANLVAAVLLFVIVRPLPRRRPARGFPPLPRPLLRLWGQFTVKIGLNQLVVQRMEFFFLAAYATSTDLAMYSVAFMVVSSAALIPGSLMTALMPGIATRVGAGEHEAVAVATARTARIVLALSVPLAAGVAVLGPGLVLMLYGPEFTTAARLVPLMAIVLLFFPLYDLLTVYWNGYGQLAIPLWAVGTAGVVDLAAAALLVPRYAAWGATAANVLGQSTAALVLFVLTARRRRVIELDMGRLVAVIAATALAAALGIGAQLLLGGVAGWLAAFVLMVFALALFGARLGFTSRDDGSWLREAVPARLSSAASLVVGPARRPKG